MKKIFYLGLVSLTLFEVLNVYFIMPMPGSQRMNSLDVAYFLYSYRWYFRILFGLLITISASPTLQTSKYKWIPAALLLLPIASIYIFNFKMSADAMFKEPETLSFKQRHDNLMPDSTMVMGVENNGEVKAYPIRFIIYHHQVRDSIGGKAMMITYCSVCRTGRVFEPLVKGQPEQFRLVGMDHFNAMFEDATTKSWWRQANGEAVTGSLKGEMLPEVESVQVRLDKLLELYPNALVMQLDDLIKSKYDTLGKYEYGRSKGQLTRTDSLSWKDKSWVVGIEIGNESNAYDWNLLKEQQIIHDKIGDVPLVLVLSEDQQSFGAFKRTSESETFLLRNDTIVVNEQVYNFAGHGLNSSVNLRRIKAYQEFWHSWRTFHPNTKQYK